MTFVRALRGMRSGAEYPFDTVRNLCAVDGRPLEMAFDLERLQACYPRQAWYHPERRSMWRFGALLALDYDDPADRPHIVSLGEGHTPLRSYDDHPVARRAGFSLSVKDEAARLDGYGRNPTLTFKDRGMSMVVSMARRLGVRRLVVPTQGNAGDALARYALAASLEAAVVMPADTPMPIQGSVAALAARHPSLHLELVEGTIREAGQRVKEAYVPQGYFNVATFQEPGWRIEGKKTMGLELAEPAPGETTWRLPDVVLYPTGGGTGILGMWKAFSELEALGLIGPERPRIVCVQSESSAPLVQAFAAAAEDTEPVAEPAPTIATGLKVPGSVGHFRVLEIVYASQGRVVAVSEAAIAAALATVWRDKGWWICPEGAACLAALDGLVEAGAIRPGERVVAFNTGSLEKYLPALRDLVYR